jgi:hypothetical protein
MTPRTVQGLWLQICLGCHGSFVELGIRFVPSWFFAIMPVC